MNEIDIINIIKKNRNKDVFECARKENKRLEFLCNGDNKEEFTEKFDYFESKETHQERKKSTSNKDLIERLLQKEDIVYTSRGGTSLFNGITEKEKTKLTAITDNISIGLSVREWIKTYAEKSFRSDPMAVVMIEKTVDGLRAYPTIKSVQSIYEYEINNNYLNYICLILTDNEIEQLGITKEDGTTYYRFLDEKFDYIITLKKEQYTILTEKTIRHGFARCPAFPVSNIPSYKDVRVRLSKLNTIDELLLSYYIDRSIRDLSKKYHGFPKLVEPITKCKTCGGTGYINGTDICPDCMGTGNKIITKVSDSIKIDLQQLAENTSLDIKKIFTYITPDIETLNKQDNSLKELEVLTMDCYYGTDNRKYNSGASSQNDIKETATKTMVNLQPIYARLSKTAEWAENVEENIIYLIGKYLYPSLENVIVKYGRDYILDSSYDLLQNYINYKKSNAPIYILNDSLELYFKSLYQDNPIELALSLKMMGVEPFIHFSISECQKFGIPQEELNAKIYFQEWYNFTDDDKLLSKSKEDLRKDLYNFSKNKQVQNVSAPELNK